MSHTKPESSLPADMANLHLRMLENDHTFSVPMPSGQSTLLDLLPAAQELTRQATAVVVEDARRRGREISCRAGCGACCRQLVVISLVEAQALAKLVASMSPERQAVIRGRFDEAIRRFEAAGLLSQDEPNGEWSLQVPDMDDPGARVHEAARLYFRQQVACPFLENESCSIHPQRPLVCREYHVTSPATNCSRLYEVSVERLQPPLHMGDVLARTAHRAAGTRLEMIPLVLSLVWSEANGARLKQAHDGLALFQTMIGEMDPAFGPAFDPQEEPAQAGQ
jgi:Fe-S-cluster containining protein